MLVNIDKGIQVVSFDIFDTLLLRPFINPQQLWILLEEEEGAIGFAKERKKADAVTFRNAIKKGGETTIEEAYNMMPSRFRFLLKKELDLERRLLTVNPEMLSEWNEVKKCGKTCIITSDMYLPQSFLEEVLQANGIENWDGFFLSSTLGVRKSSGELFKIITDKFHISPNQVLHIGDNEISDVVIPNSLGFKVFHYKSIGSRFLEDFPFARHIDGHLAGILAIGWHKFKIDNPSYSYWNRLGFIMGGVLGYIYVKWIVETANKLEKNRLLFIARDGYILQSICNALFPDIKTDYIYAPRMTSIAVNGVDGNSPVALRDRQFYYDNFLKGKDLTKLREQYIAYISKYNITEECAIVDGCSSEFSAQRLVESAVDKQILGFYLLSMAEKQNTASLFATPLHSMPFQMLSEFLFGSPEKPIQSVGEEGPKYNENPSNKELFKMSVSDELSVGAVTCAKCLFEWRAAISPKEWISYSDAFMLNLTETDKQQLANAQNAGNVMQDSFDTILWNPIKRNKLYVKKSGRIALTLSFQRNETFRKLTVSRKGIWYYSENRAYKTCRIIEE